MPLWGRRPMKIDVKLPEEGLRQNSFEFARKGIQRCIISHELFIPDCRLTWLIMEKRSRARVIRQQRANGEKERKKTDQVAWKRILPKKGSGWWSTAWITARSKVQQFIIYLEPIDNSQCIWTISIIPTEWNQCSNPPPRFALVEICGFLNCLHRFLFLSRSSDWLYYEPLSLAASRIFFASSIESFFSLGPG